MFGFLRQFAEYDRLEIEEARRQPARVSGGTACKRCGYCCVQCPCNLAEADVPRIAAFLKIEPGELFAQYLVVDEYEGKLVLRPLRLGQTGGLYLTAEQTFDTDDCVFFVDGSPSSCKIHDVKPRLAAATACWDKDQPYQPPTWTAEALQVLGWDGYLNSCDEDD
jgi:Fe-S-cluster containining protein